MKYLVQSLRGLTVLVENAAVVNVYYGTTVDKMRDASGGPTEPNFTVNLDYGIHKLEKFSPFFKRRTAVFEVVGLDGEILVRDRSGRPPVRTEKTYLSNADSDFQVSSEERQLATILRIAESVADRREKRKQALLDVDRPDDAGTRKKRRKKDDDVVEDTVEDDPQQEAPDVGEQEVTDATS